MALIFPREFAVGDAMGLRKHGYPVGTLLAAFAASLCVLGFCLPARAQTPPQGIDEATGLDYTCEGTLGYVGCENLTHPHPGSGRSLPPPKPDVWGAIAIAPDLNWGTSWNFKTKEAAQAEAIRRCQSQHGAGSCKVATIVADVCVSLAISAAEKIYHVGGPTGAINFADDNAKLLCQCAGGRNCVIATNFCADRERHMLQGQTVFSNGNPIVVPAGQTMPGGFGRRR